MILNKEKGGYINGQVVRLCGSFRVDGTSNPDVIRDGNSGAIESVVLTSTGLFTVTLEGTWPIPQRLVSWNVDCARGVAPTQPGEAHLVVDSYDQVTRSFAIQFTGPTDSAGADSNAAPLALNPDDNDMICFELVGCIDSTGTDAA